MDYDICVVSELSNPVLLMDGVEVRRADYVFRGPQAGSLYYTGVDICHRRASSSKEGGVSPVLQEFDKPIVNAVRQLKRREFLCESRVTDSVKCLGEVE